MLLAVFAQLLLSFHAVLVDKISVDLYLAFSCHTLDKFACAPGFSSWVPYLGQHL